MSVWSILYIYCILCIIVCVVLHQKPVASREYLCATWVPGPMDTQVEAPGDAPNKPQNGAVFTSHHLATVNSETKQHNSIGIAFMLVLVGICHDSRWHIASSLCPQSFVIRCN